MQGASRRAEKLRGFAVGEVLLLERLPCLADDVDDAGPFSRASTAMRRRSTRLLAVHHQALQRP